MFQDILDNGLAMTPVIRYATNNEKLEKKREKVKVNFLDYYT